MFLLSGIPDSANATLQIYSSQEDDGFRSNPANPPAEINPIAFRNGRAIIHVYFDNGLTEPVGAPCTVGSLGDEICQWAIQLDTTGDLTIVDVAWGDAPFVVEDDEPTLPSTSRSGTGGDAQFGEVGPTKLATVSVVGTFGELRVTTPSGYGWVANDGSVITVTDLDAAGHLVAARAALAPWSELSLSSVNTCGLLGTGEIRCFGTDFSGSPPPPIGTLADPLSAFKDVATTVDGACAINYKGALECWGDVGTPITSPVYRQIASGFDGHFCGLGQNLEISCWVGGGGGGNPAILTPPEGPFRSITRGGGFACAHRVDYAVECWGDDTYGQVSTVPPGTFTNVTSGRDHSCGLRIDGTVECWGRDHLDQLTDTPVGNFVEISTGEYHTCARSADKTAECWGNEPGGPGDPPPAFLFDSLSAGTGLNCAIQNQGKLPYCWGAGVSGSDVPPEETYPLIAAGEGHGCKLSPDGTVACWGADTHPSDPDPWIGPVPVGAYAQITTGDEFNCVVDGLGGFACWGDDSSGQITSMPVAEDPSFLAAGAKHACGIRPDASLFCWGEDGDGQVSGAPVGGSYLQVSAGEFHSCALAEDQSVTCWGRSTDGQDADQVGPYVEVSAGGLHNCARYADGTVDCWGRSGSPTYVLPNPGHFAELAAGGTNTCAVSGGATPECWGENGVAQSTPPTIQLASLSTGPIGHSCGSELGGATACWGGAAPLLQAEPPHDLDDDGLEDPIDNCPNTPNGPLIGTCIDAGGAAVLGSTCTSTGACGPGETCSLDQEDADSDGAGDACDNCSDANSEQLDGDLDGFGNTCDNCSATANGFLLGSCVDAFGEFSAIGSPCSDDVDCTGNGGADTCLKSQLDVDGNGIGDICDRVEIIVNAFPGGAPFAGGGGYAPMGGEPGGGGGGGGFAPAGALTDPRYEIHLTCPAQFKISQVRTGLVIPVEDPLDPPTVIFGGALNGCDETDCLSADIGGGYFSNTIDVDTVDPSQPSKKATRIQTIDSTGFKTVYFNLLGNDEGGGIRNVCAPGVSRQLLAVAVLSELPAASSPGIDEGDLDQVFDGGTDPFLSQGQPVGSADWAYVIGPDDATVKVSLSPAIGTDPSTTKKWLVKLESQIELKSATIGFVMEDQNGMPILSNEVSFRGCDNSETVGSQVFCTDLNGDLGPSVDPTQSWTVGPDPEHSYEEVFYIHVRGAFESDDPILQPEVTLLHSPDASGVVQLGILEFLSAEVAGHKPTITDVGAAALTGAESPFVATDPLIGGVDVLTGVQYVADGLPAEDVDNDKIANAVDKCLNAPDPDQWDTGRVGGVGADEIGDECQCGDVDLVAMGVVLPDVQAMQTLLLDPNTTDPNEIAAIERCSVSGDFVAGGTSTGCDIKDVVVMKRAIENLGVVPQVCKRTVLSGGAQ